MLELTNTKKLSSVSVVSGQGQVDLLQSRGLQTVHPVWSSQFDLPI